MSIDSSRSSRSGGSGTIISSTTASDGDRREQLGSGGVRLSDGLGGGSWIEDLTASTA